MVVECSDVHMILVVLIAYGMAFGGHLILVVLTWYKTWTIYKESFKLGRRFPLATLMLHDGELFIPHANLTALC